METCRVKDLSVTERSVTDANESKDSNNFKRTRQKSERRKAKAEGRELKKVSSEENHFETTLTFGQVGKNSKEFLRAKGRRRQRSSKEERREDALAPGAEEGRDKLRKAMGRSKYPLNHGYPNEGTQIR